MPLRTEGRSTAATPDDDGGRDGSDLPFTPRWGDWQAGRFFEGLSRQDVALSDSEIQALEPFFWFDLCAEHDAIHLHAHLHARGDTYSDDFLRFEAAWYADELNHYRGFRAIYRLLFAIDDEAIDARLASRTPDFGPLEGFFGDEFRLACLFAYDELATTRAYHVDFELYRSFGHPRFLEFIRLLTRDESYHYQNAMAVLKREHRDRLSEAEAEVDDFVHFDLSGHQYRATFLFDHDFGQIESGFFRDNGEILKKRLRALAGS